jgi:hypothetical protein
LLVTNYAGNVTGQRISPQSSEQLPTDNIVEKESAKDIIFTQSLAIAGNFVKEMLNDKTQDAYGGM